jgi:rubrerythrin
VARYKTKKRRKKKEGVSTYRCPRCRGILDQPSEYDVSWRCDWCGFTCGSVTANGMSAPAEYWEKPVV